MSTSDGEFWFSLRDAHGVREVTLEQSPVRNWSPEDLRRRPLPGGDWPATLIRGRGSVVMYAHVAAWAAARGAPSVEVVQAGREDAPIRVHPLPVAEGGISSNPWVEMRMPSPNLVRLTFVPARDPVVRRSPEVLGVLPHYLDGLPRGARVVLTGPGANWMYAGAAAAATVRRLQVFCLVETFARDAVGVGPGTGVIPMEELAAGPRPRGMIVGVVGDPNSGKSVFSRLFQRAALRGGYSAWVLDCDLASPTPNWYLEGARTERSAEYAGLREHAKRSWTPELERDGARQLENCRPQFDILIADLPGGLHGDGRAPERIPPGREVLFAPVDRFIILARAGSDAERGWTAALENIGRADRIAAVIVSQDPGHLVPTLEVDLSPGGARLVRGRARGLRRETVFGEASIEAFEEGALVLARRLLE